MKKWFFLSLAVVLIVLAVASPVVAMPASILQVVPVGSVHTGEPIVTQSPATLMIYVTNVAKGHSDPTWLLLAINNETYSHLGEIVTNTSLTFTQSDFVNATETGNVDFPPEDPSPPYPGSESRDQYGVNSVKSKLGIPDDGDLFYAYKELTGPDIDPLTTVPQFFEVSVNTPGNPDMKVLVLALGYQAGQAGASGKLNIKNTLSGSTLIVSELGTLLLALAPVSAFGLYKIRHKMRKK